MELTTSRLPIWPSLRARWDNAWNESSSSVPSFPIPRLRFQGSTPRREPRPTSAEVSNSDRLLLDPKRTSLPPRVNQNSFQERSVVISCSRNSNISFCQSGESLQAARNNSAEFEVSRPHIFVFLIISCVLVYFSQMCLKLIMASQTLQWKCLQNHHLVNFIYMQPTGYSTQSIRPWGKHYEINYETYYPKALII